MFRLSSKSHWDVPVVVPGIGLVHVLASHPTPPVFDDGTAGVDPDVADWNGLRNHDEIRFWADYVDPREGWYILTASDHRMVVVDLTTGRHGHHKKPHHERWHHHWDGRGWRHWRD